MTATKLGHLDVWIGDTNDAIDFDGNVICVLENLPDNEPIDALWIPILKCYWGIHRDSECNYVGKSFIKLASTKQLDLVTDMIDKYIIEGKVLVHCGAGEERSPLAVAWWYSKYAKISMKEAYDYVKTWRKETIDSMEWLNTTNK